MKIFEEWNQLNKGLLGILGAGQPDEVEADEAMTYW